MVIEEFHLFNFPYQLNGLTLTLTVSDGAIDYYASISSRYPSESNYDWKVAVHYPGRQEMCLDPSVFRYYRPRVFIAIVGASSNQNRYTLNSTMVGTSAIGG